MSEPVGWIGYQEDRLVSYLQNLQQVNQFLDATNPTGQVIPLYTSPQKYCPSENNEAYEKGFIDGMAKQRDSAVQRFVEGGTPDSELAEHKRIIREQQAEIEALKQQYELYGAVWHDEHGYQFTATVGEKVLNNDRWIKLYRKVEK